MITKMKMALVILCACVPFLLIGCSTEDITPMPEPEIVNEELPIEPDLPDDIQQPKVYDNYLEAYLDILTENATSATTSEYLLENGDGKIAIMDVLGDETPELLYIYIPKDNTIAEYLKIITYSDSEGIETVFDSRVLIRAGGGCNYCVYLTNDEELILYSSTFNAQVSYGFWPIIQGQDYEIMENDYGVYNYSADLAKLYYRHYGGDDNEIIINYIKYGEEISEKQFNHIAKEIMSNIDKVLFQSSDDDIYGEYGLYERDELWMGRTPFDEEYMTYIEACAWLEAHIEIQEKKAAIVGTWHAWHMMPSQHMELYSFFDDGTYVFQYDGYDESKRIISESGTWDFVDDKLTLSIMSKVTVEGGEIVDSNFSSTGKKIINGIVRFIDINPPETEEHVINLSPPEDDYDEETWDWDKQCEYSYGYWTMHIQGVKYWRFIDSPGAYQEEIPKDGDVYRS